MLLRDLLNNEHSKKQTMKIVRYVGSNQKRLDALVEFCLGSDVKLAQRASWPLSYCVQNHPMLIRKHLRKMLRRIPKAGHPAIRRSFVKIFEMVEIPVSLETDVITSCFNLLNSKSEFIAIRVFSMSVLAKLCLKYPELWQELITTLESQLPLEGPAYLSRAKRIIKLYHKSLKKRQ